MTIESLAVDAVSNVRLFTTRSSVFIPGEGGFASSRKTAEPSASPPAPSIPDRTPDHRVSYQTMPQQAPLYRLSGDRNPLHSDPSFATAAGFDRPMLHGLWTYGFTGLLAPDAL